MGNNQVMKKFPIPYPNNRELAEVAIAEGSFSYESGPETGMGRPPESSQERNYPEENLPAANSESWYTSALNWLTGNSSSDGYVNPDTDEIVNSTCFVAGTKIWTVDGEKNIEELRVGDVVRAYDEDRKQVVYRHVKNTFALDTSLLFQIKTTAGEIIQTTWNHPFYIDGRWLQAKDLDAGMQLWTTGAQVRQTVAHSRDGDKLVPRTDHHQRD